MVIRILKANTLLAQKAIAHVVGNLPKQRGCTCGEALKDAWLTRPEHIPDQTRDKLSFLSDRYLS
jgi:5'-methylthioadenosine phosphorylase